MSDNITPIMPGVEPKGQQIPDPIEYRVLYTDSKGEPSAIDVTGYVSITSAAFVVCKADYTVVFTCPTSRLLSATAVADSEE